MSRWWACLNVRIACTTLRCVFEARRPRRIALPDDPTLPARASHRGYVTSGVLFKEVVPVSDKHVRDLIHQNFRIMFLKDTVLPRALDEATSSTLNQMLMMNNADVMGRLAADSGFVENLCVLAVQPVVPAVFVRSSHAVAPRDCIAACCCRYCRLFSAPRGRRSAARVAAWQAAGGPTADDAARPHPAQSRAAGTGAPPGNGTGTAWRGADAAGGRSLPWVPTREEVLAYMSELCGQSKPVPAQARSRLIEYVSRPPAAPWPPLTDARPPLTLYRRLSNNIASSAVPAHLQPERHSLIPALEWVLADPEASKKEKLIWCVPASLPAFLASRSYPPLIQHCRLTRSLDIVCDLLGNNNATAVRRAILGAQLVAPPPPPLLPGRSRPRQPANSKEPAGVDDPPARVLRYPLMAQVIACIVAQPDAGLQAQAAALLRALLDPDMFEVRWGAVRAA